MTPVRERVVGLGVHIARVDSGPLDDSLFEYIRGRLETIDGFPEGDLITYEFSPEKIHVELTPGHISSLGGKHVFREKVVTVLGSLLVPVTIGLLEVRRCVTIEAVE